MLAAAAFVPSAPLLLDALGGGPDDLRSACLQAISVLDGAGRVVVVGDADQAGWLTGSIDATPYGAPGPPAERPLPLAHAVGATLLGNRACRHVGVDVPDLDEPVAFLVVGDGSARRTEKAPGHLDRRAEDFDRGIEKALGTADLEALLDLDAVLAGELLVGGAGAWRAAATAARQQVRPDGTAPRGWDGRLHYAAAPYGVGYFVASWIPRPP